MSIPDIDKRDKEDIIRQIQERGAGYTPEWRFDRENPDMGTALALVYSHMLSKTVNQLNKVLLKNKISFFNSIDAKLLPAAASGGYAVFSMVNETVPGAEVPRGTAVSAVSGEGDIYFETQDDVFAIGAQVEDIFQVSDKNDSISHIYSKEEGTPLVPLFYKESENLQKHVFYFCHEQALFIKNEAWAEISFYVNENIAVSGEILKLLTDPKYALIEYSSTKGFIEFENVFYAEGKLVLHKGKHQLMFEKERVNGIENYWIRISVKNVSPFLKFSLSRMGICTKGRNLAPDGIIGNGIECNIKEFFPFGERLSPYNEVYFACDEALSKKKSKIKLSFNMDFIRVPITENKENDEINWKWIMKKDDFKKEPEYYITIDRVIWEYYNGNGWSRLFADDSYADLFYTQKDTVGQLGVITFRCPEDISPVLISSREAYFVRARILKINNLYKTNGYFIAPLLGDVNFSYDYEDYAVTPEILAAENNLLNKTIEGDEPKFLFPPMGADKASLYIGFKNPPLGAPLKLLFMMRDTLLENSSALIWSYYTQNGFKEMNVIDETENFSRTGIVTMTGAKDMAQKNFFGKGRYWIKVSDKNDYFYNKNSKVGIPFIESLHMNAVKVNNVQTHKTELFKMENYLQNKTILLLDKKLLDICVWINEMDSLSPAELENLKKSGRDVFLPVYNETGVMTEAWIKWRETDDFIFAGANDRVFAADRNEGMIIFGDGSFGKIPPVGRCENIKVSYTCGGGEYTNVEAGAVSKLNRTIGFINNVTNPDNMTGGCDRETVAQSLARNAEMVRHRYKAITPGDIETMALSMSRNIKKAKCFTGYDQKGSRRMGSVTLAVLQKEFEKGHDLFRTIRRELYQNISERIPANLISSGQFFIIEPNFIELNLRIELVVTNFNVIFDVKKEVTNRVRDFLHPITGNLNSEGWDIGQCPSSIQIQNIIKDILDVMYVNKIYMSAFSVRGRNKEETDIGSLTNNRYMIPIPGSLDIITEIG